MKPHPLVLIKIAAIPLILSLVGGCQSITDIHDVGFNGELWDHSRTAAPNATVRLFKPDNADDVLVLYYERQGKGSAVRLRAFFLKANIARMEDLAQPRFVDPRKAEGMKPIPVYAKAPAAKHPACYAVIANNGLYFTIYEGGFPSRPYQLPTYRSRFDGHIQHLLLAPLSVAAGAATVGGMAGAFMIESAAKGPHTSWTY